MTTSSPESGSPCENAKPALVVARAANPRLQVPRGAHVPRIRNHKTATLVERAKGARRAANAAGDIASGAEEGTDVDGVDTLIVMLLL